MNLIDIIFRRRSVQLDELLAIVLPVGQDGEFWAKPLPGRRSPYAKVAISRRHARRLGLKPGDIVELAVDPITERTRSVRRAFGEPPRAIGG
jgi:hypothetical protein